MAEPINLNRVRKAKARAHARAQAGENRVKHGRTKAEKTLTAARETLAVTRLDAHRRDRPKAED